MVCVKSVCCVPSCKPSRACRSIWCDHGTLLPCTRQVKTGRPHGWNFYNPFGFLSSCFSTDLTHSVAKCSFQHYTVPCLNGFVGQSWILQAEIQSRNTKTLQALGALIWPARYQTRLDLPRNSIVTHVDESRCDIHCFLCHKIQVVCSESSPCPRKCSFFLTRRCQIRIEGILGLTRSSCQFGYHKGLLRRCVSIISGALYWVLLQSCRRPSQSIS